MIPTRAAFAILVALAVVRCQPEVAIGECRFSGAERVVTLGNRIVSLDTPVARAGEPSNEVLLLTGGASETQRDVLRLDLTTGALSNATMPYDGSGRSWPHPGYTMFAGSILSPVHPLVQRGLIRAVFEGRTFTRKRLAVSDGKFTTIDEPLFTGTRKVLAGRRVMVEQRLKNYPAGDQALEGVHIEPDGDRIVCLCNDSTGTHAAMFSQAKLGGRVQPLAAFGGEVSDRGEDDDGDGFFDAIVVTPVIRVTQPGQYTVHVRLRNAKRDQSMAFSKVGLNETSPVPVRFDIRNLTEALGEASPYDIFAIEVSRETPRGLMLLDQRHHAGRTREYRRSELPQGFVVGTGKGSVEMIDTDGDGKIERLNVSVELEFARPGEHAFSAQLRDDARRSVDAEEVVQKHLTPGRHAVTIPFSGAKIARANMSGPYTLRLTVYGPATPANLEKAFVTGTFLATDFE